MLAALTLAFAGLLLRAVWLQGVRAESLSSLGRTQHREAVTIPAGRGTIYDRSGLELALGERATTVYVNPMQITNPRRAAVAVERTLGLDADRLYPILAIAPAASSMSLGRPTRPRLRRCKDSSYPGSASMRRSDAVIRNGLSQLRSWVTSASTVTDWP